MFMPCSDQAAVPESAILACCPALNSPVVNVEALDVGSARAAILLSADEYGELTLRVRVQMVSSRAGVTYRYQGNAADFGNANAALEAALSFSEGMGFLFDEDVMRDGTASSRRRAFKLWNSMLDAENKPEVEVAEPMSEISLPSTEEAVPELLLELDGALTPEDEARASVLTKFRDKSEAESKPAPERKIRPPERSTAAGPSPELSGNGELGRIDLASEELGNEYVDVSGFLTRLLSSF